MPGGAVHDSPHAGAGAAPPRPRKRFANHRPLSGTVAGREPHRPPRPHRCSGASGSRRAKRGQMRSLSPRRGPRGRRRRVQCRGLRPPRRRRSIPATISRRSAQLPGPAMYLALVQSRATAADARGYGGRSRAVADQPDVPREARTDDFLERFDRRWPAGVRRWRPYGQELRWAARRRRRRPALVSYLRGLGPAARPPAAGQAGRGGARRDGVCQSAAFAWPRRRQHAGGEARCRWSTRAFPPRRPATRSVRHAISCMAGRGTKMEAFARLAERRRDRRPFVSYLRGHGRCAAGVGVARAVRGARPLVLNPIGGGAEVHLALRSVFRRPSRGLRRTARRTARFVFGRPGRPSALEAKAADRDRRWRGPSSDWRAGPHPRGAGCRSRYFEHEAGSTSCPGTTTWVHRVLRLSAPPVGPSWVDELRKRGRAHAAVLDEGHHRMACPRTCRWSPPRGVTRPHRAR